MARLDDGFSTTISFADLGSLAIYEKTVTPPSVEDGVENNTNNMKKKD